MVSLNCVCTLEGHKDKINYFIPGEQGFLISCSSDKSIKFWNVDEEKCYYSLDNAHDGPIYCLARTEDKKIISCSFSTIKKFDLENKKVDTIYKENITWLRYGAAEGQRRQHCYDMMPLRVSEANIAPI